MENGTISLAVGSQTASERAKYILKSNGIEARVIKIESRIKDGGCLFGIILSGRNAGDAMRILSSNNIKTRVT